VQDLSRSLSGTKNYAATSYNERSANAISPTNTYWNSTDKLTVDRDLGDRPWLKHKATGICHGYQ
jgi:hypothetical protein